MSVQTIYLFGLPGNYGVSDYRLVNVEILNITRSGLTYNQGTPVEDLIAGYQNAFGRILFGDPFAGPLVGDRIDRNSLERVSVKYKT